MADKIEYSNSSDSERLVVQTHELFLNAGWLGRCFGAAKNAPLNIAGLVVIVLLGSGVALLFVDRPAIPAGEYWKIVAVPLFSLALGYLFGKSSG